ncbi:MAG: glycine/betaine ABC transporter substrate-binding protein, partial [Tetrasphaera sp.]|nr:glycine/betaine ABC transporter substrate-binding protein [Tetrasphaera sp.]
MKRTTTAIALAGVALLALTACGSGGSDPLSSSSASTGSVGSASAGGGAVVVGSADFSESVLLAEIYAGALKAKGVDASTKTNIGSREIYLKALEDGSVQVVPEYTGALALFYDKSFDKTDPNEVYDALKAALPKNLTVLAKSAAEDNDSIVVTKETAAMLGG